MTSEKIVKGLGLNRDYGAPALWRVKNAAYDFIDAKAKKKMKKMGFRAWLGTLPKPALIEIDKNLKPHLRAPIPLSEQPNARPWLNGRDQY